MPMPRPISVPSTSGVWVSKRIQPNLSIGIAKFLLRQCSLICVCLGFCYAKGIGVATNMDEEIKWWENGGKRAGRG